MNRARSLAPLLLLWTAVAGAATPIPRLEGPVNDYAHVIPAAQQDQLRSFLLDQEGKTSNQIVVLTVTALDADTIETFGERVFQNWKLGQAGKDNGVLVVAAISDRKMRIEVGKGLEGVLTDAVSSQIIRNEMGPKFKAGDFGGGFVAGVTAINKAIRGEFKAEPAVGPAVGWTVFLVVVVVIFVVFLIVVGNSRRPGGRKRRWFTPGYGNSWYWGPTGNSWGSSGSWGGGSWGGGGGGGGYSGGGGGSAGGGASGGW